MESKATSEQIEALAKALGLTGYEVRIVRVELNRERAEDYVRQSRANGGTHFHFRLFDRCVRADGAAVTAYVVTARRRTIRRKVR